MLYGILGGIIVILSIVLILVAGKKIKEKQDVKIQVEKLRYQKEDLTKDIIA